MTAPRFPASDAAWARYQQALNDARDQVLATEYVSDPALRAQAMYFLQMQQVSAMNHCVAPRSLYPALYVHSMFMPYEISTGQACPDFLYRWCYMDGRRRYRLWGRRGSTHWVDLQVTSGFWGDENVRHVGNLSFDRMQFGADGSFDLIFSASEQPGNWMGLDAASPNNLLLVREAAYDWDDEVDTRMHIEILDREPGDTLGYTPEEMDRRVQRAARFIDTSTGFSLRTTKKVVDAVGRNRFWSSEAERKANASIAGANPQAVMNFMVFDIRPDEALILEAPRVNARYTSLSLGDLWWFNLDHVHHHGSINERQTHFDADGMWRAVLSFDDPGVPNWLDPGRSPMGVVIHRLYLSDALPIPTVKKVPFADVALHLPADTPRVTPAERAATVARRARAVMRRYGF
ncbi:MAG: hypothetical protein AB7Q97_19335 [Gammaproteobacteria bacterium]